MNEAKNSAPAAAEVDVKLAKDHTHAGEALKAGATIKVNPAEKEWLKTNGVIGQD
jgi:hypothetical protein